MKKKENKILIFGCHPDDVEIGMGATIKKLSSAGISVKAVIFTDGEPTPCGSPEKREKESREAGRILKFKSRIMGWENRKLFFTQEKRDILAGIIRKERPGTIFIPWGEDPHPDHRAGAELALGAVFAARLCKYHLKEPPFRADKIYSYFSIHLKKALVPDIYVPLSRNEYKPKREALICYRSQFTENPANKNMLDFIEARDRYFGHIAGSDYAEGFKAMQGVKADFLSGV